jgi:hypothetical protein
MNTSMNTSAAEWFVRFAFTVAGLVHLLPLAGLLGRTGLERAYGVALGPGQDLVILMQHRALLFGLVAAACGVATVLHPWRVPAGVAALVSMLGFVLLAAWQPHNAAIGRVMAVDVALALLLAAGLAVHLGLRPPAAGW